MKKLVYLILILFLLSACGDTNPASDDSTGTFGYDPAIHNLVIVDLNGAETLALKEREGPTILRVANVSEDTAVTRSVNSAIVARCDELGRIDGVTYSQIATQSENGSLTPCFKNIHFWNDNIIYGQYRPENSEVDVWFITDGQGKVQHLPNAPRKSAGLKNEKRIRSYKGKPVYLNPQGYLTSFDLSTDEEETIINTPIGHFVIIPKDNGEHIVYHDLAGGKIRRPDGSVESLSELNTYKFYYRNPSNDISYMGNGSFVGFKHVLLDTTGNILEREASSIPIAWKDWYENPVSGVPLPGAPWYGGTMASCEISDTLMICENNYVGLGLKGFLLTDSSQDMITINWNDYGILGKAQLCLTEDFIYFASAADGIQIVEGEEIITNARRLTQIQRDLSASEHLMTNIDIANLTCLDNGRLLINGYNMDYDVDENFHFDPTTKVKTIIFEPISEFIN